MLHSKFAAACAPQAQLLHTATTTRWAHPALALLPERPLAIARLDWCRGAGMKAAVQFGCSFNMNSLPVIPSAMNSPVVALQVPCQSYTTATKCLVNGGGTAAKNALVCSQRCPAKDGANTFCNQATTGDPEGYCTVRLCNRTYSTLSAFRFKQTRL